MSDISSLYEAKTQPVSSKNKLSDLLHKPTELSDKLLFALGIKQAPVDLNTIDNTDLSTLISSAESMGYKIEVVA